MLIVVFSCFMGMGIPHSMLGSGLPAIMQDLSISVEQSGVLNIAISVGTIIASLLCDSVVRRFGTGKTAFASVLLIVAALFGFTVAPSLLWLLVLCVPLGLGSGALDAGLNNYVALYYKPHHMSWLHCFWGAGALVGPLIMSASLRDGHGWRSGYLIAAVIHVVILLLVLLSLPKWKQNHAAAGTDAATSQAPQGSPFKLQGMLPSVIAFVLIYGVESSLNYWGSTYLAGVKAVDTATAAQWLSWFFMGITLGRLLVGFLTMRLSNTTLIRAGQCIMIAGAALLLLPAPAVVSLVAFILIGLGCAPIVPCILHETPTRFGAQWSQRVMGLHMAFGYCGSMFIPPLLGWLFARTGFGLMPAIVVGTMVAMLFCSERVNKAVKQRSNQPSRVK